MATSAEDNIVQLQSTWVDATRRSTRLTIKRSLQDAYWPQGPSTTPLYDCKTTDRGLILRRAKKSRVCDPLEASKHGAKLNFQNRTNSDRNTHLLINIHQTAVSQDLEESSSMTLVRGELRDTLKRNETSKNSSCQWLGKPDKFAITQHQVALQIPAQGMRITSSATDTFTLKRYRQLETVPFMLSAGESLYNSACATPGIESDFMDFTKPRNAIELLRTPQMLRNHVAGEQVDSYSSQHKRKISEPILRVNDVSKATSRIFEPINPFHGVIPALPISRPTSDAEKPSIPGPAATIKISSLISSTSLQKGTASQVIASSTAKLDPIMPVPMWCDTDQELCESLPFFRSLQSGCYIYNGVAFGFVLDELTAQSGYISDNVIILQAGGQSIAFDSEKYRRHTSQVSAEKAIKALIWNQMRATPIVLVLGSNCPLAPVNVPHRYCVMDWFIVTHSWENLDQSSRCKFWNFRFERMNSNTIPWWHNPTNETKELPVSEIETHLCPDCETSFPQIYKRGYMCLNSVCSQFWKVGGQDAPADDLQYREGFLAMSSQRDQGLIPFDLYALPHARDALSVSGWHCHKCGKLNSREAWEGWMCSSPGCEEKVLILDRIDSYLSSRERDRLCAPYTGTPISTDLVLDEDIVSVSCRSMNFGSQGCYRVMKYEVVGIVGTIHHVIPNKSLCEFACGPDDIFKEYKRVMSIFRRYPLQNTKLTSRTLSRYFAHNAGAHYIFHETTLPGMPFYLCPKAISMALNFIQDIARAEGIPNCQQFNEVLSLAYVESQRLGYHNDFEAGETVASISLGSRAVMKICKKDESVAGDGLNSSSGHETCNANSDMSVRSHNILATLTSLTELQPILELDLCHGDMVILHGADIQRRLVKSVIPKGEFMISATARYVRDD
ncbi:hypothetical protein V1509DRAFT_565716 [Lipomyces kononenkoae]